MLTYLNRIVTLALPLVLAVSGCNKAGSSKGGQPPEQPAGNPGGQGPGTGTEPSGALKAPVNGVALKVESARNKDGDLQVSVRFANGDGAPVVLAAPQFQMRTLDGLMIMPVQVAGSADSAGTGDDSVRSSRRNRSAPDLPGWLVKGEDPVATHSLAKNSTILLRLKYELGMRAPVAILFTEVLPQGDGGVRRTAESEIVFDDCTECNTYCTYTDVDRNNCGGCGVLADSCEGGKPQRYIFDDDQNCGAEGRVCAQVLSDLTGQACLYQTCAGATPATLSADPTYRSCNDVCAEKNLVCVEGLFVEFGSQAGFRAAKKDPTTGHVQQQYESCNHRFAMQYPEDQWDELQCACGEKKD
jgi:hypothetical protein